MISRAVFYCNSKIGIVCITFHRRFPFLRVMAFEIGGPVGEQGVGNGVGFVERIREMLFDIVKMCSLVILLFVLLSNRKSHSTWSVSASFFGIIRRFYCNRSCVLFWGHGRVYYQIGCPKSVNKL